MTERFEIGEVAIMQNLTFYLEYNGMECTVIGALAMREAANPRTGKIENVFGYRVDVPGHAAKAVLEPHQLRKRRPPQDWVKLCQLDVIASGTGMPIADHERSQEVARV